MDGTGAAGTALAGRPAPALTRPGSASRRRDGGAGKPRSERMASGRFGSVEGRSPRQVSLRPRRIGAGPAPLRARVRLRDGNRRQGTPAYRSIPAERSHRRQRVADASLTFGVVPVRLPGQAWNCAIGGSPVSGHRGRDPEPAAAGRGYGPAAGDAEPRARGHDRLPLRAVFSGHATGGNWRLHDRLKPCPEIGRKFPGRDHARSEGDNWAVDSAAPPLQTVAVTAAAGPGRQSRQATG